MEAKKAWVVSIGRRDRSGLFLEYSFFYVGHPTRQSATDAVRRNLPQVDLRRVKAERELGSDEIAQAAGLQYRQVKLAAKGRRAEHQ